MVKLHTEEEIINISTFFGALSSPTRLKILLTIMETKRPLHIKAVAKILKLDYAAIYRHVGILNRANLLKIYEVGRSRVLSLLHEDLIAKFIRQAKEATNKLAI
jgi:DNA-binding transcriptional ArsR family regulator